MSDYFATLRDALSLGPPPELEQAADILRNADVVYTFGNGACAALAGHIATDLGKGAGMRVVSLVENAALLTAYANDHDYDCVFEQPLRALLRPGDVAFGLSASGRSTNVIAALELAREADARTIAFTGRSACRRTACASSAHAARSSTTATRCGKGRSSKGPR